MRTGVFAREQVGGQLILVDFLGFCVEFERISGDGKFFYFFEKCAHTFRLKWGYD